MYDPLRGDHPVAGPSSRPYSRATTPPAAPTCELGLGCPYTALSSSSSQPTTGVRRRRTATPKHAVTKRQGSPSNSSSPAISPSSSNTDLFIGPTTSLNTTSHFQPTHLLNASLSTLSSDLITASDSASPTATSSRPWTTYYTTRTWRPTASASATYVPGVLFNLTLAGDSDSEAVYSIPLAFGHNAASGEDVVLSEMYQRPGKRASDWDGGDPQTVNMQVDLGSSDMWVALDTCTTPVCLSSSQLFNASESLASGTNLSLTYHNGIVSGEIYWEEVALGGFGIGYQAFVAANQVTNEDLTGGNFSGLLGLALPQNSLITEQIPGTTGSNPDGATFLDNLFGSGESAPTERFFALSLGRREDVRTYSSLGVGAVDSHFCPVPCNPVYIPIIAQPNLGAAGYLHWRIPIEGVSATIWTSGQTGTGNTTTNIPLGPSFVDVNETSPIAVLDSGGVPILVGYKPYADALYGAYGISASSDGYYRTPCTTQLAFTLTIAGEHYPVHPLDMTWPDPADPSQETCIGAIQYSSSLSCDSGDFILGSAFMKSVYSIFQYPDVSQVVLWQPTVGLVSLINASTASRDFYAVRNQHQSLSAVSAASQQYSSGSGGGSGSTTSGNGNLQAGSAAGHRIVSGGAVAAIAVVAFFVFAAGLFCAWWFWLRRQFGAKGVVVYNIPPARTRSHDRKSEYSMSSSRNRKQEHLNRQKSTMEGFSDFEGDSWMSTTEGADSIRLGYLPELAEEDDGLRSRAINRSSRGSSLRNSSTGKEEESLVGQDGKVQSMPAPPDDRISPISTDIRRRDLSPPGTRLNPSTSTMILASPVSPPRPAAARGMSLSMSGPFPSSARQSGTSTRPDSLPMYDIRTSDFSTVQTPSRGRRPGGKDIELGRGGSASRGRRTSPSRAPGWMGDTVTEEPAEL